MFPQNNYKHVVSHGVTSAFSPHTIDNSRLITDPIRTFSVSTAVTVATPTVGGFDLGLPELPAGCSVISASLTGVGITAGTVDTYSLGLSLTRGGAIAAGVITAAAIGNNLPAYATAPVTADPVTNGTFLMIDRVGTADTAGSLVVKLTVACPPA